MSLSDLQKKLATRVKARERSRKVVRVIAGQIVKLQKKRTTEKLGVKHDQSAIRVLHGLIKKAIKKERETAKAPTVMYDSTTVTQIPADAECAAGYVGGSWPTFANGELRKWCPGAKLVSIAVASRYDADCLDVERGDATPAVAPDWVKRQLAHGKKKPILYSSVSEMPAVLAALRSAGISRDKVRLWTAHYSFKPHLCDSSCGFGFTDKADATQWTDRSDKRNLDQSLLSKDFFNV